MSVQPSARPFLSFRTPHAPSTEDSREAQKEHALGHSRHHRVKEEGLRARMILQVHDGLNFSCPPDELERLKKLVLEEMSGAYTMAVPLIADDGVGKNWLEAH